MKSLSDRNAHCHNNANAAQYALTLIQTLHNEPPFQRDYTISWIWSLLVQILLIAFSCALAFWYYTVLFCTQKEFFIIIGEKSSSTFYFPIKMNNIPKMDKVTAAVKSLQSCPTLCDPIPGILQARTLEWVAISFSSAWKWKVQVKSLSHVWLRDPMDCTLPGSSIHGIFQARVLEWGAIAFSRIK